MAHISSCAPAPFSSSMHVSARPIYVNARRCPSLLCLIHVCARRHRSFRISSTPKSAAPVFASHLCAMVPISSSSHPHLCASAPVSFTSMRDGVHLSISHSRQVRRLSRPHLFHVHVRRRSSHPLCAQWGPPRLVLISYISLCDGVLFPLLIHNINVLLHVYVRRHLSCPRFIYV
ncbi:hypothetical protein DFH08DRAFT_878555 [Mycena albidolilacea]|uniref:Uncharacterized protein n=1 Tax=Mycena albidolilacea TaxID=1033008 RepID=A0AAD7EL52_9AGAR|nr:hypothetical protein DFH08DRAFT_878555 [Mycena albidolilacea]